MENKSYLWDIAAGAAIVNAAGGEALILNQNEKFQVDVRFSNSLIKVSWDYGSISLVQEWFAIWR